MCAVGAGFSTVLDFIRRADPSLYKVHPLTIQLVVSRQRALARISLKRIVQVGARVCLLAPVVLPGQIRPTSALLTDENDDPGIVMQMVGAQEPPLPVETGQQVPTTLVTVHGVVTNASTGEPLPHALVRLSSGDAIGALSDGEGRFAIPGVPMGLQTFEVVKPGFQGKVEVSDYTVPASHAVRVAAEMPELRFMLAPENALSGQITLSTGDPGVSIGITLLRQTIENGHARWTEVDRHQTTPEGSFRFSGLRDGSYLLMTQPAFDNERATAPPCEGPAPVAMPGYPNVFYGQSAEVAGAARIVLGGGQQLQANLILNRGMFHAARITPAGPPLGADWNFSYALLDRNGLNLEYPVREDAKSHTLCGYLPDGSYTVTMEASTEAETDRPDRPLTQQKRLPKALTGMTDFSVEGRAEMGVRVPLTTEIATPIRLRYEPEPPKPKQQASGDESPEGAEPDAEPLSLAAVRAEGVVGRGQSSENAFWWDTDLYELSMVTPGAYWIDASTSRPGVCLGAVTAGGQSLAHTPWSAGPAGTGSGIDVVLRTDCAKLTVQLPARAVTERAGEDPTFYIYIVPEFDSVSEVHSGIAQASSSSTVALEDMTPGTYRVLLFDNPQILEYRSLSAMARLAGQGQEVTLEPNGTATLVLEVPER